MALFQIQHQREARGTLQFPLYFKKHKNHIIILTQCIVIIPRRGCELNPIHFCDPVQFLEHSLIQSVDSLLLNAYSMVSSENTETVYMVSSENTEKVSIVTYFQVVFLRLYEPSLLRRRWRVCGSPIPASSSFQWQKISEDDYDELTLGLLKYTG